MLKVTILSAKARLVILLYTDCYGIAHLPLPTNQLHLGADEGLPSKLHENIEKEHQIAKQCEYTDPTSCRNLAKSKLTVYRKMAVSTRSQAGATKQPGTASAQAAPQNKTSDGAQVQTVDEDGNEGDEEEEEEEEEHSDGEQKSSPPVKTKIGLLQTRALLSVSDPAKVTKMSVARVKEKIKMLIPVTTDSSDLAELIRIQSVGDRVMKDEFKQFLQRF